jgi:hypothetical protein
MAALKKLRHSLLIFEANATIFFVKPQAEKISPDPYEIGPLINVLTAL